MKYKMIIEGEVPEPKVGEQYCDWGIGGKTGFSCSVITEVTDDCIVIQSRGSRQIKDTISMEDYVYGRLKRNTLAHIVVEKINKTITIEEE